MYAINRRLIEEEYYISTHKKRLILPKYNYYSFITALQIHIIRKDT